jgi:hypothetical protein
VDSKTPLRPSKTFVVGANPLDYDKDGFWIGYVYNSTPWTVGPQRRTRKRYRILTKAA